MDGKVGWCGPHTISVQGNGGGGLTGSAGLVESLWHVYRRLKG